MTDKSDAATSFSRRNLMKLGVAAGFAPQLAFAQTYPSKPIRLITGYPGGDIDFTARLLARGLSEVMATPVIVDTKPGASGVIACDYVAKAAGDGYTLLIATPSSVLIAAQATEKRTFEPLTDLKGINLVSKAPLGVAVNPRLGISRMKDLVALSRTRPVTLGTSGLATSLHVLIETLNELYNANFQVVPYRSTSQSTVDAVAGHIDGAVSTLSSLVPFHQSKRLIVTGVTSPRRVDLVQDAATIAEDFPGFTMENWMALFAPGTTPPALIQTLDTALQRVLAREDVKASFAKVATTSVSMASPAEFQTFVGAEYQRFGKVIRERHIVAGKE